MPRVRGKTAQERERSYRGIGRAIRWHWVILGREGWWGPYGRQDRAAAAFARIRRLTRERGLSHADLAMGRISRSPQGWIFQLGKGWTADYRKARHYILTKRGARPNRRDGRRRWRPLPNPTRVDRPRHVRFNPHPEEMLKALRTYHARGVPVVIGDPDMEVTGKITEQITGRAGPEAERVAREGPIRGVVAAGAMFRVRLEEPTDREDYEAAMGMHEGGARRIFEHAAQLGHLDPQGRLREFAAPWSSLQLYVPYAKRGTLVEYQTPDPNPEHLLTGSRRDVPGRIVGIQRSVDDMGNDAVLIELFEPLPRWLLPYGTDLQYAKDAFHSGTAFFLPRELYERLPPDVKAKVGRAKALEIPAYLWRGPDQVELAEQHSIAQLLTLVGPYARPRDHLDPSAMGVWFIIPVLYPPQRTGTAFRPMREMMAEGIAQEVWAGMEWLEGLS